MYALVLLLLFFTTTSVCQLLLPLDCSSLPLLIIINTTIEQMYLQNKPIKMH